MCIGISHGCSVVQTDFFRHEGHDAFVIDHGTIRDEGYLLRLITLIGFDRLGNGPVAN